MHKSKFKIEGWEVMFEYSVNFKYAIKYDLKKYFGFSFQISGKVINFIWTCLPYGYTLGPLIARYIMKPLINFWISLKVENACFFDDGMACDKKFEFLKKGRLTNICIVI